MGHSFWEKGCSFRTMSCTSPSLHPVVLLRSATALSAELYAPRTGFVVCDQVWRKILVSKVYYSISLSSSRPLEDGVIISASRGFSVCSETPKGQREQVVSGSLARLLRVPLTAKQNQKRSLLCTDREGVCLDGVEGEV